MYATLHEGPSLAAARAFAAPRGRRDPAAETLPALEEQVCAEAGLWAPDAARRAVAQADGDVPRAVALVKVWAATLPHLQSEVVEPDDIRVERRISSAYSDVPGGQWLGFAPDLAPRVLEWTYEGDAPPAPDPLARVESLEADAPARSSLPRVRRLLADVPVVRPVETGPGFDPAATVPVPPLDRPTRLGVLARGETASLVTLASLILGRRREAVLAELTVSTIAVKVRHPRTGVPCPVAEVPVVEAEAIVDADIEGAPGFAVGWGATLGTAERRAISLALIDAAMQADGELDIQIPLDEQTVLSATDGSSNNGFVEHLRLPHYASFASYVAQARAGRGRR